MLAEDELVDRRRFLSAQLTYAASIQQLQQAALVDNIQNAEKIPRLMGRQDDRPKDSQKIETGAPDTRGPAPHPKRSAPDADLLSHAVSVRGSVGDFVARTIAFASVSAECETTSGS
jgi:hypothetical protein